MDVACSVKKMRERERKYDYSGRNATLLFEKGESSSEFKTESI